MAFKGVVEAVSFDVKAKLEEKERKSQMSVVGFSLLVSTKPSIVKFEIDGNATLTGKDTDIQKMLEVNSETKMPVLFQRIYQSAFTAMYLLSTILNTPPPPNDLLHSDGQPVPIESVSVEIGADTKQEPNATTEVDLKQGEKSEAPAVPK